MEANEAIDVDRTNKRWNDEELRMMAAMEADATIAGDVRFMNQHLLGLLPDRTLDSIKGKRRSACYRELMNAELSRLQADVNLVPDGATQPTSSVPAFGSEDINMEADGANEMSTQRTTAITDAISTCIDEVRKCRHECSTELIELGNAALRGPFLSRVTEYRGTRGQRRRQRYAAVQKTYIVHEGLWSCRSNDTGGK